MAIERALTKQPKVRAPQDARCYICLEGEDGGRSSKLMRGCACRGDSAGFVHLKCLTELARSKEASGDLQTIFDGWNNCGNCKQNFQGALGLEMDRRFWRRHRSSQNIMLRYNSTRRLAVTLGNHDEVDVANQLVDEASTCAGNNTEILLDLKLYRADLRIENGQKLEGLGLLKAMLPAAKAYTTNPKLYCQAMLLTVDVLLDLDRNQEAHEAAADLVVFSKANCGLEDPKTLRAMSMYACACARLGRMDESKANFKDVLTIQTRVLGREHSDTQVTWQNMRVCGFAEPSG